MERFSLWSTSKRLIRGSANPSMQLATFRAAADASNVSCQHARLMNIRVRHLVLATVVIALSALFVVGCGRSATAQPQTLDRIRQVVAKILETEVSQIDVRKPLGSQGADELDIVNVVMALEEEFNVEILDSAGGEEPDEVATTLTVQKLADIVAEKMK